MFRLQVESVAWPLIDAIRVFQKAGILMFAGLDYQPELSATLVWK